MGNDIFLIAGGLVIIGAVWCFTSGPCSGFLKGLTGGGDPSQVHETGHHVHVPSAPGMMSPPYIGVAGLPGAGTDPLLPVPPQQRMNPGYGPGSPPSPLSNPNIFLPKPMSMGMQGQMNPNISPMALEQATGIKMGNFASYY